MEQNQKYIKAILDHSPESIILIGLNHEILAFNKTIRMVLKQYFGKQIELGELYYPTYVVETSKQLYLESFHKAIKGESVTVQNKTEGEGFSAWFEYKVLPVYDEEGRLFGVSLSAKDINKEKEAEEEIRKLNESLESKVRERTDELLQSNRELDAFNYAISHDLQQPLIGVKMILGSVQERYRGKVDEDLLPDLRNVTDAIGQMSLLIKKLLNLSQHSKIALSKRQVNMDMLVKEVCGELKHNERMNTPEILINKLPDSLCDPLLIKQVWINLISNAMKYSGKKERPVIEISCEDINNESVYSVKDNGVGFNMQQAEKLFMIFQRFHKESEFDGNGIGLATVHRIISRHGGRVWAEAEKDKGAAFYFTLS